MQCTRCYSSMQLVKRENHQDSYLEWHQCPLCQRLEFLSHPVKHEQELALQPVQGNSIPVSPA